MPRRCFLCLLVACTAPDPETPADALEEATAALTGLGSRLSGTPSEADAAGLIADRFAASGLEVDSEPFTWNPWQPGPATLTLPDGPLSAWALSPSPPTDGLRVRLVDGAEDVTDAAALYSSDDASRAEQFILARSGDAAAMIRVTEDLDHDGGLLAEVGHTLEGSSLPAVAVDRDGGARLRQHLGAELTLDIASEVLTGHTSHNVAAVVPGSGPGIVYVVAHYDAWHPSVGAIDNALGVAMLLRLAALLPLEALESDVVLLATSGEEQGLQGAKAWTIAHDDEIRDRGRLVVTLDIPWSNEGVFTCSADPQVEPMARAAAEALAMEVLWPGSPNPASDHLPFQVRGVPAIWCTRQPDRHYHTVGDTLEWIDFHAAQEAFELAMAMVIAGTER